MAVPGAAVGAVVAAVGGDHVTVRLDPSLELGRIRLGHGPPLSIVARVLLKGNLPAARGRFLDDARNATRLGADVRDVLARAWPEAGGFFRERYGQWSRSFARKVLRWHARLQHSRIGGHTVRNVHDRIYLLEWAGARVDPNSRDLGPRGLARLPDAAETTTLAAYEAYIRRLVTAVT